MIAALKRLSGASDASLDDFQAGTGTFIVSFKETPKIKRSEVAKSVGKYKLSEVKAKITTLVTEKDGSCMAGDVKLAAGADQASKSALATAKELCAAKKKGVLYGVLTEDEKSGALTLTLQTASEAK